MNAQIVIQDGQPAGLVVLRDFELESRRMTTPPSAFRDLPPTPWDLISLARGSGETARCARGELVDRYEYTVGEYIYALLRGRGLPEELARQTTHDLRQEFFLGKFLESQLLQEADRNKGLFRWYLKTAVSNYVVDSLRKGQRETPLGSDVVVISDKKLGEDSSGPDPERVYYLSYYRDLVREAFRRTEEKCTGKRQRVHFQLFAHHNLERPRPTWKQLARRYRLSSIEAWRRASTAHGHFHDVLAEMLMREEGSRERAELVSTALLEELDSLLPAIES